MNVWPPAGLAAGLLFCRCLFFFVSAELPAQEPSRAAPSRPGAPAPVVPEVPLALKKIGGRDYVKLADFGGRLGLSLTLSERGKQATLAGPRGRVVVERDGREALVEGLRVFLGDPVVESAGALYLSRVDADLSLAPLLQPGRGVAAPAPVKVVVLDPGHGGKDNGTSALEKTYALDVARRVKKGLERAGFSVVLTRESDSFLELTQRTVISNTARADLFVSIHFNALPRDNKTSGVEVFTFAPPLQRSTNSWSPREPNDAERTAAPVNRHDHWSAVLAHAVHRRFVLDLKTFDRGKKLAHWGVLRGLDCPGVLIECGFLTSTAEARKIGTLEYRQQLAAALVAGISDYSTRLAGVSRAAAGGRAGGPGRAP